MKKKAILFIAVFVFALTSVTGCSQESNHPEAIQIYLENEFTGPNKELRNILDKSPSPAELQSYTEENYGDIVADLEKMVMTNHVLVFLRNAHKNGYQLQPKNIEIQKIENTQNNVYDYKVEVEYSKNGQTNSATITGTINLDDNGKIVLIRKMEGAELFQALKEN